MPDFEDIVAKLNPKLRARVSNALDITPTRVKTASQQITVDLGGGFPLGRVVTLWGSKSAGKTTLALQTLGLAQKDGYGCAMIDAEGTYDSGWAARLGVDNNKLIYSDSKSVGQSTDDMLDLIKAEVDIILVDSIGALVPSSYLDDEELKGFDGSKQIGTRARDIGRMLELLNYQNKNTLIIFISQGRMAAKGQHWGMDSQGGKALQYYSSQMVRLTSYDSAVKDEQQVVGNSVMKLPTYREVDYFVQFNKLGPQSGTGTYNLFFRGDDVGVDNLRELIDLAVKYGIIEKGGAWLTYEGEKRQGWVQFKEYLKLEPNVAKQIEEELYAVI